MPANLRCGAGRHTDLGLLLELHSASVVAAICKSGKWHGNVVSGMVIKEHDDSNICMLIKQTTHKRASVAT